MLMEIIPKPKAAASLIGVSAVGLAIAATAIGALAIGALASGRLAIRQGRIERRSIGELTVDKPDCHGAPAAIAIASITAIFSKRRSGR